MSLDLATEIDRNYDFLQRNLAGLLAGHRGEFVLLRDSAPIEFFQRPGDAYRAGLSRFPDEIFSVQKVDDKPVELGHMSIAFD